MTLKKTFFLLLFLPTMLCAQRNGEHNAVMAKLYPSEAVETYDLRSRKKVKRVFYYDDWMEGQFLFFDQSRAGRTFPLKYDILNQELNVDMGGSIYIVPLDSIHGFVFESLINKGHEFTIRKTGKGYSQATIFEVVEKGTYKLLTQHYVERLRANYQPALDTGSRDEKIVRKQAFYLIDTHGRLIEIPKKKKAAEQVMSKYKPAQKYLGKNKVNFKNEKDLKKLVLFMNNYQKK